MLCSIRDFLLRIFRDHGNIPGLDIAFIENGYVYHTDQDTPDRIPDGSIQRSGDNVLSVIMKLSTSSDTDLGMKGDNDSPPVFFDVFGIIVVSYPSWIGTLVNLGVSLIASVVIINDILEFSKKTDIPKVLKLTESLFG